MKIYKSSQSRTVKVPDGLGIFASSHSLPPIGDGALRGNMGRGAGVVIKPKQTVKPTVPLYTRNPALKREEWRKDVQVRRKDPDANKKLSELL